MAPKWLTNLLDQRHLHYTQLHHEDVSSAEELAEVEHFPADHVARVVAVLADNRLIEVVVPATRQVDLKKVRAWAHCEDIHLASDLETDHLFPDCERGAIPAMRHWTGCPVLMDRWMDVDGDILFEAGTHHDAIRMTCTDWIRLVNPVVGSFSVSNESRLRKRQ